MVKRTTSSIDTFVKSIESIATMEDFEIEDVISRLEKNQKARDEENNQDGEDEVKVSNLADYISSNKSSAQENYDVYDKLVEEEDDEEEDEYYGCPVCGCEECECGASLNNADAESRLMNSGGISYCEFSSYDSDGEEIDRVIMRNFSDGSSTKFTVKFK